jgi:ParB-like chromosome segregation protein Spo0J
MLRINETYRSLIPALTEEEFKQLEENCLKHGIREPLVTSDGILLDGHNRYEIAQKNGLEYETIQYLFDTEYDRVNWIINNQLGRRNVTEEQKAYLRGKRYEN